MTETSPGTAIGAAEGAAPAAAADAARERQSHVRHELRAPLAVVYPLLSLLLDGGAGELTAQQREYLEVIERNVTRLDALVTGTAGGWADCSQAPPAPAAVALRDVAEELVALRHGDRPQGPPVAVEAGGPPGPRAWADHDDVRQIVGGLVGNSAAYAPGNDAIVIRVADGDEAGTVVLEVVDSGPGMPPEELARAFEFGFRGALARSLKVPGLGAGLWVCRELALRNGGELTLSSEPGTGTTATLVLPAAGAGPA